jgi:hypothetical protein
MIHLILITLLTSLQVFLVVPLIIGHFFKIQGYTITDQTMFNNLIKKLEIKRSTFIKSDKPYGFFYGKWYLGYIQTSESDRNKEQIMYLVVRRERFEKIKKGTEFKLNKEGKEVKQKIITICERKGGKWWRNYTERQYNATKNLKGREPFIFQKKIMDKILKTAKKKPSNSGTFFVYGEPGVGKSLMTFLFAKEVNGYFCNSWSPIDASDQFSKMYSSISPTEEKPLVLVLEEADKILYKLIHNEIEEHKNYEKEVVIKSHWNGLLDKITDLGYYPNVYFIITSNSPLEDITKLDSSLLRKGRIDKSFHITMEMLVMGIRNKMKKKFKTCLDKIIQLNKKN